jgi:outer membrane murein-binding lipoprotein Lpp
MRVRPLCVVGTMLMAVAGLSGCKREPSFDERYAGAQTAIREKAAELETDMAQRAREANSAVAEASDAPPAAESRPI